MSRCLEVVCKQGTPEWHRARRGCLSASRFHILMEGSAGARNRLLEELEGELLTDAPAPRGFFSKAMAWGVHHEPTARARYCLDFGAVHESGFLLHQTLPYVGCSPDGVCRVGGLDPAWCDSAVYTRIVSGVEIKCPFNPEIHAGHVAGNIASAYFWQLQFSLWVTGADFWDFVSFNPRAVPPEVDFYVRRFRRDESIMAAISTEVSAWCEHRRRGTRYSAPPRAKDLIAGGLVPKFFT